MMLNLFWIYMNPKLGNTSPEELERWKPAKVKELFRK